MKTELPCINCITLPMCRNRAVVSTGVYFTQIFGDLAKKCSLIKDYAKRNHRYKYAYSLSKTFNVVTYLIYGSLPQEDIEHEKQPTL